MREPISSPGRLDPQLYRGIRLTQKLTVDADPKGAIVIGGGIVGVSTLYELVNAGFITTLFETREEVACETSFANGGLLTDSMSDPWNCPGVGRHLFDSLVNPRSAMKLQLHAIPGLLGWGLKFLRNSTPARYQAATRANYRLASASVRRTNFLHKTLDLQFDASLIGTLKFFESREAMAGPRALTTMLEPLGLRYNVLDRDGTIRKEPLLAAIADRIYGSIYYPSDGTGDACMYTRSLATKAEALGGTIKTSTSALRIVTKSNKVIGVETDRGFAPTSLVVVAAGNSSSALTRQLGVRLPVTPVKGYSVTFTAPASVALPRIPVIDNAAHTVATPLGRRLRIAGTAEFTGYDKTVSPHRIANLVDFLRQLYPSLANILTSTAYEPWAGLRPMSADGVPYIGATAVNGVWLNSGHGHLGWTMAAGSAKLVVDLITGNKPEIEPAPYSLCR